MRSGQSRARLADCAVHGPGSGAELFIVEGESAAAAVAAVRRARAQAVLPLQGKPMNAWRASADKVRAHALYAQLAQALGIADATALETAGDEALAALRFERLVLLFDPDADGIHIGALALMYLQRWAPALLVGGRVVMVRAPMFLLRTGDDGKSAVHCAYTPDHCRELAIRLTAEHGGAPQVQAVRGLASLAPDQLGHWCVEPATRTAHVVTPADAVAAAALFAAA